MSMKGITECSVPGCSGSVEGYNNLCDNHRLPGAIVAHGQSTMVVTMWVADHKGEVGFILLNDYALGELFGGRGGFEAKLVQQGFRKVRNIGSPQQLDSEKARMVGRPATWSGPWLTEYPWELE
jgi:hypothetical protein